MVTVSSHDMLEIIAFILTYAQGLDSLIDNVLVKIVSEMT